MNLNNNADKIPTREVRHYSPRIRRDIRATGWFHILCGIASIAFGVRSVIVESSGWPTIGGVFVAVAGLLYVITGVIGAIGTNSIIYPAYMAISLLAATIALTQLCWASIAAYNTQCFFQYCSEQGGLHMASAIIALVELIICISSAMLSYGVKLSSCGCY